MKHKYKSIFAANVGNTLEWYDFCLYGYFAPVFATLFFPSHNRSFSLILTYASFAVGFLVRPLGGILFGYIGDHVSRTKALNLAFVLIAIPTFCMGLLPTYQQIGIWAPILLIVLRLLQGLSVAGQYTGSVVYVAELAHEKHRAFAIAFVWLFMNSGFLLGSFVSSASVHIGHAYHIDQIWRLPFLLSAVLFAIGMFSRRYLNDSVAFKRMTHRDRKSLWQNFRKIGFSSSTKMLILAILGAVTFNLLLVYSITYLHHIAGIPLADAMLINMLCIFYVNALVPLFGLFSDRVGRKPPMLIGCVGLFVLAIPVYYFMGQGHFWLALLSLLSIVTFQGLYLIAFTTILAEIFPTHFRYTGASLSYNIGYGLFGGTAPLIATSIIYLTHQHFAPAYYLMACALAAFITVLTVRETYQDKLH
tara:strand:- start:116435 stop:117688 length:1254 start_codon:yes stop_codon:yes gene_type:complete